MKKAVFLFTIFILLITSGCSSSITPDQREVQIPQKIIDRANSYLMTRMSIKFFRQYITLDTKKSSVDSPWYHIAYRFSDPDKPFIDEIIMITSDMDGAVNETVPVQGIPLCSRDSILCTFNIDELKAVQIAKDNGLEKGIKDWKTDFTWDSKFNRYVWVIKSIKTEGEGSNGPTGSGEQMIIDPAFGKILDRSDWFVR